MYRFSLIFYLILTLQTSIVNATENIMGFMDCNVEGVKLIEINEGKHKEFSGYKNGIKPKDKFEIIYKNSKDFVFSLALEFNRSSSYGPYNFVIPRSYKSLNGELNTKIIWEEKDESCSLNDIGCRKEDMMFLNNGINRVALNSDYINANTGVSSITAERYFKNDWNGIHITYIGLSSLNITFKCTNRVDKIEEIIKKINH